MKKNSTWPPNKFPPVCPQANLSIVPHSIVSRGVRFTLKIVGGAAWWNHVPTWLTIPRGIVPCSLPSQPPPPGLRDQKVYLGPTLTTVPTLCSEARPRPPAGLCGRRLRSDTGTLVPASSTRLRCANPLGKESRVHLA